MNLDDDDDDDKNKLRFDITVINQANKDIQQKVSVI